MRAAIGLWVLGASALGAPAAGLLAQPRPDQAWQRYLEAPDGAAAQAAAGTLAAANVDLRDAVARLKAGRTYVEKPAGLTTFRFTASDGTQLETVVETPKGYRPDRRWPVRVQLHGGVSRPREAEPRPVTPNRIEGEEAIYLYPRGHARAEWWHLNQYEHMVALVDWVKRNYNVDENRVYLTGISDGATGDYFYAMKLTTPFSAFLPLNGNMRVLATPGTRANGQLYAGNLVNKPLFVVNGGLDPLYPVAAVAPHIEVIRAAGAAVEFRPQPEAGHDTSWWPAEREAFAQFVATHPRQPHPESLSWESERTDRYNRAHWLVIDRLGRRPGDSTALEDVNRLAGGGVEQRMYARTWPSGRVDARRSGNTFDVRTRGVTAFTLLLSPDAVDFSRPVIVRVNGEVVFNGPVAESLRTLLDWHARDDDRTMLYTAALPVQVP
jgi:poly(3-hydroxybutyrate) depolymerase